MSEANFDISNNVAYLPAQETLEHVDLLAAAALRLATRDGRSPAELTADLDDFQYAIGRLGLENFVIVEDENPVSQLTRLRHKCGMTQRELASMMGCSNAYLSRIENGERSSDKITERVRSFLATNVLQAYAVQSLPPRASDPAPER